MTQIFLAYQRLLRAVEAFSPLLYLAIRVLLFCAFYKAGMTKFANIEGTADWFTSLGIPLPTLMAYTAALTELVGAFLLLVGFATRLISLPLIIVMLVAIFSVHLDYGWSAIASGNDPEIAIRLERGRALLADYGHYDWLTEKGAWVILNNGVEFSVIYLLFLWVLLTQGPGRWVSIDHYIQRFLDRK